QSLLYNQSKRHLGGIDRPGLLLAGYGASGWNRAARGLSHRRRQGRSFLGHRSGQAMQGNSAKSPLACLILAVCLIAPAIADDDSQKFLQALRDRHYFDTAQEYLDRRAADPNVSPDFKRSVPYERALILIESAAAQRDPLVRDEQLAQAQAKLKEFI